jgi:hypothetical protein
LTSAGRSERTLPEKRERLKFAKLGWSEGGKEVEKPAGSLKPEFEKVDRENVEDYKKDPLQVIYSFPHRAN